MLGHRGDSCRSNACADPLICSPKLPGGYCASTCGTGEACDGTCVDSRDGELCAKSCASDRDCRSDEGYVCDPQWHACLVPNFAAPVVKQCPTKTPPRDTAFGDAALVAMTGDRRIGTSAVLTDDGDVVTRTDARLARDRKGTVFSVMRSSRVIELTTSTDRGATWSTPLAVDDLDDCGERGCDRPLITIGKEIVYVLYAAGDNGLRVRASHDGGKTFTTGAIALGGTNASAVATGDGKLHVVAMTGSALGAYGSAQQVIQYTVSSDGGATFSPPIVVSGRDEKLPYFFATPVLAVD
ncbi:MAG TPA: sialidase family protein, partial [Kofleriaceae bacterium]|nr:sialidase family protein [Kofleriaceae bacterium]